LLNIDNLEPLTINSAVKHFTDIEDGAAYLDFIIEKDLRENGGY